MRFEGQQKTCLWHMPCGFTRGQVDRERSTRTRGGGIQQTAMRGLGARLLSNGAYFGIFQGGRVYGVEESMPISSTVSASPSARVVIDRVFLSAERPGKIVELFRPAACSKAGNPSSETPSPDPLSARAIRCRNHLIEPEDRCPPGRSGDGDISEKCTPDR